MVTIITGEIDSGKTTRLISLYKSNRQGDGFALPKFYWNGIYIGQKIIRLSTGVSTVFSLKRPFLPSGWREMEYYKNYSFSEGGMLFATQTVDCIIESHSSPVYLDEIGPLELEGKGLCELLLRMLAVKTDLYITVRSACLQDVMERFQIKPAQFMTLSKRN